MIHYQLRCDAGHAFDGWFRDSASFDRQAAAGLVDCPECGGTKVARALMAPAIPKKGRVKPVAAPVVAAPPPPTEAPAPTAVAAAGPMPARVMALLQRMRAEVESNCDYVGNQFADEARRMERGESDRRAIYGEATEDEAEALRDEGIEIGQIPWVPRSDG
ncbi:DUF1178 family protein [Humitalea sp. 24SJ18S-53]|uniref:DUF1178 family protein n=1 Tax=Humitalea sp. 24SJ18S-53 TaxID=3422307 RepID=UPI003D67C415